MAPTAAPTLAASLITFFLITTVNVDDTFDSNMSSSDEPPLAPAAPVAALGSIAVRLTRENIVDTRAPP
eukprot:CAMPEP_0205908682 /NCGR_PEP_ID=MMETSP1325-20131115/3382_1 /ASSEMBLY_ACC=CAM_ASM_000708 /TAXON_ID=236786 /ORGANISM="Florenciella sp., Strain RCC1007" /LENGTH=68 /DNA_ID=CAMNT_0053274917 /DNA_START=159 /DNA_END=362 /DNA_ORIENTATION=+